MKQFYKQINGVSIFTTDERHKERLEKALNLSENLTEEETKIRLDIYINTHQPSLSFYAKNIKHALALYNEVPYGIYDTASYVYADAVIVSGEENDLSWLTPEGNSFMSYDASLCVAIAKNFDYVNYLEYLYDNYE